MGNYYKTSLILGVLASFLHNALHTDCHCNIFVLIPSLYSSLLFFLLIYLSFWAGGRSLSQDRLYCVRLADQCQWFILYTTNTTRGSASYLLTLADRRTWVQSQQICSNFFSTENTDFQLPLRKLFVSYKEKNVSVHFYESAEFLHSHHG